MNKTEAPKVSNYTAITAEKFVHRTHAQERAAQGGLAILIRNNVTVRKVLGNINIPSGAALETLGVRVALTKEDVDLWNIYRPATTETQISTSTCGQLETKLSSAVMLTATGRVTSSSPRTPWRLGCGQQLPLLGSFSVPPTCKFLYLNLRFTLSDCREI